MKKFRILMLVTLAVMFFAADFTQAQIRRSRPKPQTATPSASSSPANDGWSDWRKPDANAKYYHRKLAATHWAGSTPPSLKRYRADASNSRHFLFEDSIGAFIDVTFDSSGKVSDVRFLQSEPVLPSQTAKPQTAVSPTGDGWSAWKRSDGKIQAIFRKAYAGHSDPNYKVQQYRIDLKDSSHYEIRYREPLYENGSRPVGYNNQTIEVRVKPDGSVGSEHNGGL